MLPCNRILCATDFSEASFEALKTANELAAKLSAELLLEHVRPATSLSPDVMATPGFSMQSYEQQIEQDTRKRLEDVAAKRVPQEVRKRLIVRAGDAGHEILETAARERVDLIVIATHGMSGWRHYLHGSVAERVIRHTPCAVLVVRCPQHQV